MTDHIDNFDISTAEGRREAAQEARQIMDWASLSCTIDPLAGSTDKDVDERAAQGEVKGRISQVIRRCQREIDADVPEFYAPDSPAYHQAFRDCRGWAMSRLRDELKAGLTR